ncbi:glycoside hydrolase family 6 protein [Microbispora sp. RL4-1S]|uniref:Glycoside hydrolase family 6 protein n=1 Tax=Microbispora oryzae TaxID=2806554 RepID=A0A940WHS4_9ACTN|nr:glycoside hydrolase family 6 protein [Microbispora oryzae]MBP2705964.1 glycoside hydrolase family 6 protein [Microbispora oryzae]
MSRSGVNGGGEPGSLPGSDDGPRSGPQHPADLRKNDPRQVGPYRLLRRLGEGGMGTVYLGEAPDGTRVAVKLLHHTIAADPGFRRRFRREVEAAKRVARFCTAAVLDAEVDGETVYLVTEYVAGPTLRQAVERDGPLRGSSLDGLAVSVAVALRAIHAAGIIHRDLKPGNVLLSPVGPKVIDFGVAHLADAATQMSSAVVGTPSFMSPEQFEGGPLTPASDVFAWAGTVAYAGTGRAPFGQGSLPVVLNRVLNGEPDLTGLDGPLGALVARALAKDPAVRPTVPDILDVLTGSGPVVESPILGSQVFGSAATTMPGGVTRRRGVLGGVVAGVAGLAVIATVAVVKLGGDDTPPSGPAASGVTSTVTSTRSAVAGAAPAGTPASPAASKGSDGNPLREPTVRFAYRPDPDARRQADVLNAQGRKADAALMRALAAVPHPVNLNATAAVAGRAVASAVRLASARHAVPVFVTDQIPMKDCSQWGQPDERSYRAWIDRVAKGIGSARTVVVLEPNSLTKVAGSDSCSSGGKAGAAERYRELGYAVNRLGALPHTAVYLDGGIEGWPSLIQIADRLVRAGVERADGFYLNAADYQETDGLVRYGESLSRCLYLRLDDDHNTCSGAELDAVPAGVPLTHFVIDTSRNGKGGWSPPDGKYADPQAWCNPPGRGVGIRPTTDTGSELVDAYLWLRAPEMSNGQCTRGGPGPQDPVYKQVDPIGGTWWAALALDRARNAVPPLR